VSLPRLLESIRQVRTFLRPLSIRFWPIDSPLKARKLGRLNRASRSRDAHADFS
jgi:hypothetical protein